MSDVVVIGGGVIGLSIAYELAGQGVDVTVLEQGQFGREASWAGAGILPPGNPKFARSPEARLRAASHVLWPKLAAQLTEETGIDNGYFNCGGIEVRLVGSANQLQPEIETLRTEGVQVNDIALSELFEIEPALNRETVAAFQLPEKCQVRNPRHLKALVTGCTARGVSLLMGQPVHEVDICDGRVTSVCTPQGVLQAGQYVITAGPWTASLARQADCTLAIQPVLGQMVLLSSRPLPFRHVIASESRYLVPRPDGRILVGSTEECVGFNKRNTPAGVGELIQFARQLVPSLGQASFEKCWSGLRPQSADGLPYMGAMPEISNLFVASGHFRSGLQASAATAVLMRQIILGQETLIPIEPYACGRSQPDGSGLGLGRY
jgi:glycine oxidase